MIEIFFALYCISNTFVGKCDRVLLVYVTCIRYLTPTIVLVLCKQLALNNCFAKQRWVQNLSHVREWTKQYTDSNNSNYASKQDAHVLYIVHELFENKRLFVLVSFITMSKLILWPTWADWIISPLIPCPSRIAIWRNGFPPLPVTIPAWVWWLNKKYLDWLIDETIHVSRFSLTLSGFQHRLNQLVKSE